MTTFDAELRAALTRDKDHKTRNNLPHAYASQAGGCSRQISFKLAFTDGEPEEFSIQTLLAFRIGNDVHAIVQDALQKSQPDCEVEVPWMFKAVSGRADGLYVMEDGTRVVVEIKTLSPWSFDKASNRDKPHAEHVMQAQLSALALDAQFVRIIYVNKASRMDKTAHKDWLIPFDPGLAEIEFDRLNHSAHLVRQGLLGPRFYDGDIIDDPAKTKFPCGWCAFKSACIELGPGIVAWSRQGEPDSYKGPGDSVDDQGAEAGGSPRSLDTPD